MIQTSLITIVYIFAYHALSFDSSSILVNNLTQSMEVKALTFDRDLFKRKKNEKIEMRLTKISDDLVQKDLEK